jgi:hypothetical protein
MEAELVVGEVVLDKDPSVGRKRAGRVKGTYGRTDPVVEVHEEDVRLADSSGWAVGMLVLTAELEEPDRSERSERFAVVGQAALVVMKHMDSGAKAYVQIYLARHKVVEGCLDMAKGEKLANHFEAYRGPSVVVLDRTIHDGGNGTHSHQTHFATQQMGVVDHTQEHSRACPGNRAMMDNASCLDVSIHVLPPFCRAAP